MLQKPLQNESIATSNEKNFASEVISRQRLATILEKISPRARACVRARTCMRARVTYPRVSKPPHRLAVRSLFACGLLLGCLQPVCGLFPDCCRPCEDKTSGRACVCTRKPCPGDRGADPQSLLAPTSYRVPLPDFFAVVKSGVMSVQSGGVGSRDKLSRQKKVVEDETPSEYHRLNRPEMRGR